jgi:hypothetical protein
MEKAKQMYQDLGVTSIVSDFNSGMMVEERRDIRIEETVENKY